MTKLHTRIIEALRTFPDGRARYDLVMYKVWPYDKYPRAMRNSHNGGPPGVCMHFGRALREMQESSILWRPNERGQRFGQPDIQLLPKWRTS